LFRNPSLTNFKPLGDYFADAHAGKLPAVAFISLAQHEHPPLDVRAGEYSVARIVTALRKGTNWKDSVLFLTYDENGGYYDHARPPAAPSPDGIPPGRCADLNNPPISRTPGKGSGCELSSKAQRELCATARPGERCADFVQFGFRDPLIAISPFAKRNYVSHTPNDQTSILALIERRFLGNAHLTARDASARSIEDLFDFTNSPSRDADVPQALAPPAVPSDSGCAVAGAPASTSDVRRGH
jgi:phospholipase C